MERLFEGFIKHQYKKVYTLLFLPLRHLQSFLESQLEYEYLKLYQYRVELVLVLAYQ